LFGLELNWDRPSHTGSYSAEHVLRVRVRPSPGAGNGNTLPVKMAIALDSSSSMEGEKLTAAKDACTSVLTLLRVQDRVSIASFATHLVSLIEDLAGDSFLCGMAQNALTALKAGGVTRTDAALDWIQQVLKPEAGTVRVAVLITDGHATNPRGAILHDLQPLIAKAAGLGKGGVILFTAGVGSADGFNVAFLDDLSKPGRGAYLYADTPGKLKQRLDEKLSACQAMAIEDAQLTLRPLLDDVKVTGLCRIRPDFVPMDASSTIRVGSLRVDVPTDFLISVAIPPRRIDRPNGSTPVMGVILEAKGAASTEEIQIEYTPSFSRAQQVDVSVDQDRLAWEINSYADALARTADPDKTGELLANLEASAQRAGQAGLAAQASQQLDELKASGKLSSHRRSQMLTQSRALGGNS
jgi:Ca-activated chloride channel homolog